MPEITKNGLSVAAMVAMAAVLAILVLSGPAGDDRIERLGSQVKCPVCQGESIADSPAQMARDMMALIEERVAAGASDTEIIDELLSSYSGAVLLDPPASGSTLALWLAPAAALIFGIIVIVWWRRQPIRIPAARADTTTSRSPIRTLVGGLVLAVVAGLTVVIAGFFVQERQGTAAGVADIAVEDLSEVSNETMEAVVAANLGNPQINRMRLALAERYYESGDYRSAFPHYLAVAESSSASDDEVVASLVRLGWMAWDGNGEAEPAIGMFDEALSIDEASTTARYLKGVVVWCGMADHASAGRLLSQVLADPDLPADSRSLVEADLAAIERGESCT